MKLLKWQQLYVEKVIKMNNKTILEETIADAGGDDYDGCFTEHGYWCFDYIQDELNRRLGDWLNG